MIDCSIDICVFDGIMLRLTFSEVGREIATINIVGKPINVDRRGNVALKSSSAECVIRFEDMGINHNAIVNRKILDPSS